MDRYITGAIIKKLRENKKMTQTELAEILNVSDKAISKWETGKSYPDITLIEPIAHALGISTIELLSGNNITNKNRSFNMLRAKFYVCPICGNVLIGTGEAVISCCGITLPPLDAETADEKHQLQIEIAEDEYYITTTHEMTKEHYISFIAFLSDSGFQLIKMYSEWNAEARFKMNRNGRIFYYCNKHGLFTVKI